MHIYTHIHHPTSLRSDHEGDYCSYNQDVVSVKRPYDDNDVEGLRIMG
jgi:hypothetical protein